MCHKTSAWLIQLRIFMSTSSSFSATLITLAHVLEKKPYRKHILFAGLTILTVILYGYYTGTFDQVSHIPFLKKSVDPTLFPHDKYFDLRLTHYSFFWQFFIPFYKVGLLEIALFITHVGVVYLTFWGIWQLTHTLFQDTLVSLLAVCAMLFPHFGFSGFPFLEFSLLNRTFALPFELFALHWYFQKKTYRAVILLGILFNVHVVSVNFLMAMILLDMIMRIKSLGVPHIVKHIVLFIAFASPVLVWRLNKPSAGVVANWEWFDILDRGVFAHLFHFISIEAIYIPLITLGGVASVVITLLCLRRRHQDATMTDTDISAQHFVYAGILVLCVQCVASYVVPSALIIQAQITRVGVFLILFCYIYASAYVAERIRDRHTQHTAFVWFLVLIFSFTPFLFLLVYWLRKHLHGLRMIQPLIILCIVGYAGALALAYYFVLWRPGVHIYPSDNAFNQVQRWAKDNTSKDAIFITPPHMFWLYDVEWRVLSERSSVSTISELLEAAFDPGYISYWKPRFEDVAPGALAKFNRNFYVNLALTARAYRSLDTQDVLRIGQKYDATYVVTEKPFVHKLPLIYENEEYRVYAIR